MEARGCVEPVRAKAMWPPATSHAAARHPACTAGAASRRKSRMNMVVEVGLAFPCLRRFGLRLSLECFLESRRIVAKWPHRLAANWTFHISLLRRKIGIRSTQCDLSAVPRHREWWTSPQLFAARLSPMGDHPDPNSWLDDARDEQRQLFVTSALIGCHLMPRHTKRVLPTLLLGLLALPANSYAAGSQVDLVWYSAIR